MVDSDFQVANQHPPRGFTVIETMIVLAIASLILLVVVLAIPALTRNSRNNQRTQDVQSILSAISNWELNHSGNIPSSSDNYLQNAKVKLSFYEPNNVTIHGGSSGSPAFVSPATSDDKVDIYNYQKCDPGTPGRSFAQGAGYSNVVALYAVETGGGLTGKCRQL